MVEDVFSHEDIVSGLISKEGNLLVCFEESRGKGIKVYPLIFNDNIWSWKFNLGTQELYHKTSIPICTRAERSFWGIVVTFHTFEREGYR